jgi:membrane protease YdiL (CAAX protease family)
MRRIRSYRWLSTLAVPPGLVITILFALQTLVSPVFAPNHFLIGFSFGCAAGFFEEIGWTGFAFPMMRLRHNPIRASILLGLLWSVWHIPVIDYLGSATPHARCWLPFFLAFTAAMTAARVLICWIYSNINSVLLAQAFHASSTGALAAFGPFRVSAGEEALWYGVYGMALWAVVAAIVAHSGATLASGRSNQAPA